MVLGLWIGFILNILAKSFYGCRTNGLGWFGAKWVWFFTTAGILIGLMFMFVVGARDHTGWEDLSSLAMFAVGAASGFAAGLIVESIMWIVRKRKS